MPFSRNDLKHPGLPTHTPKMVTREYILWCKNNKSDKVYIVHIETSNSSGCSLKTYYGKRRARTLQANGQVIYGTLQQAEIGAAAIVSEKKLKGYKEVSRSKVVIPYYDTIFNVSDPVDYTGEWKPGYPLECISVDPQKYLTLGEIYKIIKVYGSGEDMEVVVETEAGELPFYKERFKIVLPD